MSKKDTDLFLSILKNFLKSGIIGGKHSAEM